MKAKICLISHCHSAQLFAGAAILMGLALMALSSPRAQAESLRDYWPLEKGNSWTYGFSESFLDSYRAFWEASVDQLCASYEQQSSGEPCPFTNESIEADIATFFNFQITLRVVDEFSKNGVPVYEIRQEMASLENKGLTESKAADLFVDTITQANAAKQYYEDDTYYDYGSQYWFYLNGALRSTDNLNSLDTLPELPDYSFPLFPETITPGTSTTFGYRSFRFEGGNLFSFLPIDLGNLFGGYGGYSGYGGSGLPVFGASITEADFAFGDIQNCVAVFQDGYYYSDNIPTAIFAPEKGPVTISFFVLRRAEIDGAATGVPPGTITGTVKDAAGAKLSCGVVEVGIADRNPIVVATDLDGKFSVPKLVPGQYTVTATSPGYVSQVTTITVQSGQTVSRNFRLALSTESVTISGRVIQNVNSGERELVGVRVELLSSTGTLLAKVFTCADGRFEFRGQFVTKQTGRLRFSAQGFNTQEAAIQDNEDIEVVLEAKSLLSNTIQGTVKGSDDKGLASRVICQPTTSSQIGFVVRSDSGGVFSVTNLDDGDYELTVSAEGHATKRTDVLNLEPGPPRAVIVKLSPASTTNKPPKSGCQGAGAPSPLLADGLLMAGLLTGLSVLTRLRRLRIPK